MLNKVIIMWGLCLSILSISTFGLERPNILWLTSEDNSASWLGCYGNENAKTPNLDKLASEGVLFWQAYLSGDGLN